MKTTNYANYTNEEGCDVIDSISIFQIREIGEIRGSNS